MGRLEVTRFSDIFPVRRITEGDIPALYQLTLTSPQFYEYCGPMATTQSIREDLTALPPGKTPDDKYYVGFYEEDDLVAVLDLIDGYPGDATAYIGFFMVRGSRAGHGLGSRVIQQLCGHLAAEGFSAVRLAYVKKNPQASHFWTKNRFVPIRETDHKHGHMVIAERTLSNEKGINT